MGAGQATRAEIEKAITRLARQGYVESVIAKRLGVSERAVRKALDEAEMARDAKKRLKADPGWTDAKIALALQMFGRVVEGIADEIGVPPGELLALYVRGRRPAVMRDGEMRESAPAAPWVAPPAPALVIEGRARESEPTSGSTSPQSPEPAVTVVESPAVESRGPRSEPPRPAPPGPGPGQAAAKREGEEKPKVASQAKPIPAAAPVRPSPIAPPRSPTQPAPAAELFRLVNKSGQFLHASETAFTAKAMAAWEGTRRELDELFARAPAKRLLKVEKVPA